MRKQRSRRKDGGWGKGIRVDEGRQFVQREKTYYSILWHKRFSIAC